MARRARPRPRRSRRPAPSASAATKDSSDDRIPPAPREIASALFKEFANAINARAYLADHRRRIRSLTTQRQSSCGRSSSCSSATTRRARRCGPRTSTRRRIPRRSPRRSISAGRAMPASTASAPAASSASGCRFLGAGNCAACSSARGSGRETGTAVILSAARISPLHETARSFAALRMTARSVPRSPFPFPLCALGRLVHRVLRPVVRTRNHRRVSAGTARTPARIVVRLAASSWYSSSTFTVHTSCFVPRAMFSAVSIAVYIEWSWLL